MNLKNKEELKTKLETLTDLLKCVPSDLIYEHTEIHMEHSSNMMLSSIVGLMAHGDKRLALNFLLRMVKDVTNQIKFELGE